MFSVQRGIARKNFCYPDVSAPDILSVVRRIESRSALETAHRSARYVWASAPLRGARWEDIDLDADEWRYNVTKTDTQHIVPLAVSQVSGVDGCHMGIDTSTADSHEYTPSFCSG